MSAGPVIGAGGLGKGAGPLWLGDSCGNAQEVGGAPCRIRSLGCGGIGVTDAGAGVRWARVAGVAGVAGALGSGARSERGFIAVELCRGVGGLGGA